MVKYIYLTKPEIEREEDLFAPRETAYAALEETERDIRSYTPPAAEGDDMLQVLGSC
ncbi:MAG: hypothetical protein HYX91_03940 [Chloroflexi bacterium]|nr:hypothetical protein [Chloroflexota bacterium]